MARGGAGKASASAGDTRASSVAAGVSAGDTGSTGVAAKGTADGARLTLETVVALLTAGEDTALLLVVVHGDSWELRGRVVLSSVVVNLVDWHGSVCDVRLNDLLVNDRLNGLVDVLQCC